MKRNILILFSIISSLFLLAACGSSKDEDENAIEMPTISEEERLADDEVVVTVNDVDVTGMTYNLVYTQLKLRAAQTGQEVSNEDIQELTIDSLIDRQLLLEQAEKEGLLVSDEAAKEELEQLREANAEGLETLLEQFQITENLFQHQLVFEMTVNDYLAEKIDVEVTNEEVKEAYEEAKEQNEDLPELTEIHDTLKGQIEERRVEQALQDEIESLKETSEIEVHL